MEVKQFFEEIYKNDSRTAAENVMREIARTETNSRQSTTFLQRFFNYTGLSYKEPVVLNEKAFTEEWKRSGKPEILYHLDFCNSRNGGFITAYDKTVEQVRSYTLQYMGLLKDENGKPYGQYYENMGTTFGNGLYLGKYEFYEWMHKVGHYIASGTGFKCFINSNAKRIAGEKLIEEVEKMREKYPGFEFIYSLFTSYNNCHGMLYSEMAAILGYDVIEVTEEIAKRYMVCDFTTTTFCVINRSVLTICDQIGEYEAAELVSGEWKEPGKVLFQGKGVKAKLKNHAGTYRIFDGNGHYKTKDANGVWHEYPIEKYLEEM